MKIEMEIDDVELIEKVVELRKKGKKEIDILRELGFEGRAQFRIAVGKAMNRLKKRFGEAIRMDIQAGKSIEEAAKRLGIMVSTARVLVGIVEGE